MANEEPGALPPPGEGTSILRTIAIWAGIFAVAWVIGQARDEKPKPRQDAPVATRPVAQPRRSAPASLARPETAPTTTAAEMAPLFGATPRIDPTPEPLPSQIRPIPALTSRRLELTPPRALSAPNAPLRDLPPVRTNGDVRVRGYHRADGTYVRPHTRSRPSR